jgi:Cu+-exporting ATPase
VGCAARVRETLSKVDGVASVDIDFEAKTATLTCAPGKTVSRAAVEKAFAGSPYGVTSFSERTGG